MAHCTRQTVAVVYGERRRAAHLHRLLVKRAEDVLASAAELEVLDAA